VSESWYSDEALAKQAAARDWPEGTPQPVSLLFGILEPRIPPEQHERCVHCGSDARDEAGGGESKGVRWCGLCLSRRRDDDYTPTTGKATSPPS